MIETRYKNKTRSGVKTFIKRLFIGSIVLMAVLVTSCGAIPGATECNTVVNSFMQAGAAKDVNAAYDLCVEEMAREDIENLILGQHQLFAGYQNISIKGINIEYKGARSFAEYSGEAKYSDGRTMWVEAELVKRGDNWELVSIWISP